MNCSKITPVQMIAALHMTFVQGDKPPAINEHGQPVYKLASFDTESHGCAMYTLAKLAPELMKVLESFSTHEACSISGVRNKTGLRMSELFSTRGMSQKHKEMFSDEETCEEFLQALQQAHDDAAIFYFNLTKFQPNVSEANRLSSFRDLFADRMQKVVKKYELPQDQIKNLVSGKATCSILSIFKPKKTQKLVAATV